MGSLLDKAMAEEGDNSSSTNAAQADTGSQSGGGSLLDQAMSAVGNASDQTQASVHQQFHEAASQLSPDELHSAATNAVQSLPADQQAQLGQALASQGAAEGAGVPADTKKPSEIGKMVSWVHNNVPGGVPGALGLIGGAGVAAGGAYVASQNPGAVKDAVGDATNAGSVLNSGTASNVFNALQNAVKGRF